MNDILSIFKENTPYLITGDFGRTEFYTLTQHIEVITQSNYVAFGTKKVIDDIMPPDSPNFHSIGEKENSEATEGGYFRIIEGNTIYQIEDEVNFPNKEFILIASENDEDKLVKVFAALKNKEIVNFDFLKDIRYGFCEIV